MKRLTQAVTAITLVTFALLSGWGGAPAGMAASTGGGSVLPASETPHGYSLTDMTGALALFTTSGNNPAYYPSTPFQILYADFGLTQTQWVTRSGDPCPVRFKKAGPEAGCGFFTTQAGQFSNTFQVSSGTMFFVPLWNADDSPPVVGDFPKSAQEAGPYFFDASQLGAQGFEIIVDGSSVPIGADYVAGPVKLETPLLDGGGHKIITLGAFLGPMAPGAHTVEIKGGLFGALIAQTYCPATFFSQDLTFQVKVS